MTNIYTYIHNQKQVSKIQQKLKKKITAKTTTTIKQKAPKIDNKLHNTR